MILALLRFAPLSGCRGVSLRCVQYSHVTADRSVRRLTAALSVSHDC